MSFAYHARRVRDPARPPWLRLSSLRACVSSFCWLTGLPYRDTLERLGLAWTHGIPREPPADDFLRRTLDGLERERSLYLSALRGWETHRVRAKLRGGRQPSRAERGALAGLRERVSTGIVPVPPG